MSDELELKLKCFCGYHGPIDSPDSPCPQCGAVELLSPWTHRLCDECWRKRAGAREPVRVTGSKPSPCCQCGAVDASGIYVREDPARMQCGGRGPGHDS